VRINNYKKIQRKTKQRKHVNNSKQCAELIECECHIPHIRFYNDFQREIHFLLFIYHNRNK
jgi:hypothetical protein